MLHLQFSKEFSELLRKTVKEINYYYELLDKFSDIHVYVTRENHHEPVLMYRFGNIHRLVFNLTSLKNIEKELTQKAMYIIRAELFRTFEHFAPNYLVRIHEVDKHSIRLAEKIRDIISAPLELVEDILAENNKKEILDKLISFKTTVELKPTIENFMNFKKYALAYSWLVSHGPRKTLSDGMMTLATLLDSVKRPYNREYLPSLYYYGFSNNYAPTLEPEYFSRLARMEEPAVLSFANNFRI